MVKVSWNVRNAIPALKLKHSICSPTEYLHDNTNFLKLGPLPKHQKRQFRHWKCEAFTAGLNIRCVQDYSEFESYPELEHLSTSPYYYSNSYINSNSAV